MSADNGVYIVKFPEGFRVTHAQGIENIDYYTVGSKKWRKCLKDYFGKSPVFKTEEEAFLYAHELENEVLSDDFCPILEYGVCYLGEYGAFEELEEIMDEEFEGEI